MSYPVMTPSAAQGLLQSIFWKPEFDYVVTAIEVLAPIEWINVRRNEVNSVLTSDKLRKLRDGWHYDVTEDRGQRNTVALRDVAYRIRAQMKLAPHATDPVAKYREQLRRRVERGACFQQPHFGCREFAASFGPAGSWQPGPAAPDRPTDWSQPIERSEELGLMLHSIVYLEGGGERYRWFRATLEKGVLSIPDKPLPDSAVDMPRGTRRVDATRR